MADEPIWYKSYHPDVPKTLLQAYPLKNLADILVDAVREFPDKPALLLSGKKFQTTRITYGQLDHLSTNFAKNLYSLGIRKGERVVIFLPNFPEFIIAFFGIQKLGAICVPLNVLFSTRELDFLIRDSGAKAIVTSDVKTSDPAFLERVHQVAQKVDHLEHIIVASVKPYLGKIKRYIAQLLGKLVKLEPTDIPWEKMIQENDDISLPALNIDPKNDVALIPYTGGTTGLPKGVMLTHYNLITNLYAGYHWTKSVYSRLAEKGKLRFLVALPLFHLFGSLFFLFSIFIAGEIILVPNPRERKFTELLELIDLYKPHFFPFVPTGYLALVNHPNIRKYDLTSIDFCMSAAAPLPIAVMKQFEDLSGTTMLEGWGLTETSPIASANPSKAKRKIGSVGIPFIDTVVKVFNPDDKEKELDVGEVGELGIKGPQIMKGYWNKPKETAHAMNSQGFFMSGDIGRMDDEGFIYIEDRKKDMIIASGYKVFPREVEEYFFKHPDIENVAIVGIPDEYRGERPKAFVVLKQGATTTIDELMDYAKKGLAKYKVPTEVEIRDTLPLSAVGKVLRRELREEVEKED